MRTKISVLILAACLSGCVSTRRYKKDLAIITKAFQEQLKWDQAIITTTNQLADGLKHHAEIITDLDRRADLLENPPALEEVPDEEVPTAEDAQ